MSIGPWLLLQPQKTVGTAAPPIAASPSSHRSLAWQLPSNPLVADVAGIVKSKTNKEVGPITARNQIPGCTNPIAALQ
jgi:LDH2 family malate/lactate/ureidoglycolate dehydrogenase